VEKDRKSSRRGGGVKKEGFRKKASTEKAVDIKGHHEGMGRVWGEAKKSIEIGGRF